MAGRQADSAAVYAEKAAFAFFKEAEKENEHALWKRGAEGVSTSQRAFDFLGKYKEGNAMLEKTYSLFDRLFPDDAKKKVGLLGNMARNYYHMDEFAASAEKYELARFYLKQLLPFGLKEMGRISSELATVQISMNQHEEANRNFEKALEIFDSLCDTSLMAHCYIQMAASQSKMGNPMAAEQALRKAQELLESLQTVDPDFLGQVYVNLGANLNEQGRYLQALDYAEKSLFQMEKRYGKEHPKYGMPLEIKSTVLMNLGNYYQALEGFTECAELFRNYLGPDHSLVARSYNNLANVYQNMGDYPKALGYLQKTIDIEAKVYGSQSQLVVTKLLNKGVIHQRMNEYEESIQQFLQADQMLKGLSVQPATIQARIDENLGTSYSELGEFTKAEKYLTSALKQVEKLYSNHHPRGIIIHVQLGYNYLNEEEYDKAKKEGKTALELTQSRQNPTPKIVAPVWLFLAKVYEKQNKQTEVRDAFQNALSALSSEHAMLLPLIIKVEKAKAEFHANQQEYAIAFETYTNCMNHIHQLASSLQEESAQLFLKEKYVDVFSKSMAVAFQLAELDPEFDLATQSWSIIEQSKSSLLTQKIQQTNILSNGILPDSLLNFKKNIQQEIATLERKINTEEEMGALIPLDKKSLEDRLFRLKLQEDSLKDVFEDQYPRYAELIQESQYPTLSTIQREIPENTAMIEYLLGEKHSFVCVIRKESVEVLQLQLNDQLDSSIYAFRKLLLSPPSIEKGEQDQEVWNVGHDLFQALIAPIETLLPERLIIVPDGALAYLPFEVLLTKPVEGDIPFHRYPFWLNEKTVSYAFSGALWLNMKNKKMSHSPNHSLLAFAPSFPESGIQFADGESLRGGYLGPLAQNQEEAVSVADMFAGNTFLDTAATLQEFLKQAHDYRIIHLATHGKVHDAYPLGSFLAFAGKNDSIVLANQTYLDLSGLYLADLYQLQLNADLVVLSACETGVGKLYRGEGVASLARGFTFAGTKSLLTTLWSVSDGGSQRFMEIFYEHLKSGQDKATALRNAKREFMQLRPEYAAPFYWSGYILMGDTTALEVEGSTAIYWILLGLVLMGLVGLWRKYHRHEYTNKGK